jgi:hypothetical protein
VNKIQGFEAAGRTQQMIGNGFIDATCKLQMFTAYYLEPRTQEPLIDCIIPNRITNGGKLRK